MIANPTPAELKTLIKLDACVEEHRNLFCGLYDDCLDEAVEKGWASWTCVRRPMFARPQERGQLDRIRERSVLSPL